MNIPLIEHTIQVALNNSSRLKNSPRPEYDVLLPDVPEGLIFDTLGGEYHATPIIGSAHIVWHYSSVCHHGSDECPFPL
jgi:hypothetical protein